MTRYLNFRGSYGVETVDQLSQSDFPSYKDFRKELTRLIQEYRLAGMNVYPSCRACKGWN